MPPAGIFCVGGVVSCVHVALSHFGGFAEEVGHVILHMFTVTAVAWLDPRFWTSTVAVEPVTVIPFGLACHADGCPPVFQSSGTGM
jgi:hypothetical protein